MFSLQHQNLFNLTASNDKHHKSQKYIYTRHLIIKKNIKTHYHHYNYYHCYSIKQQPLIKICGITNVEDAVYAASQGADYIGMIMYSKAKRYVSKEKTKSIVSRLDENVSKVGVFVDAEAEEINEICEETGIDTAQLHGDTSRLQLNKISKLIKIIYVLNVNKENKIDEIKNNDRIPEWLLIDGMKGGSGQVLAWDKIKIPSMNILSKNGYFLAGGLNPDNVKEAIRKMKPDGVDVSSGVCSKDGIKKDFKKIETFIKNLWWNRQSSASADANNCQCSYRTVVDTQCRFEPDDQGKLQQKCERIFREFKECTGEPPEIKERREEITNPNYDINDSMINGNGGGGGLEGDMNKFMEEFFNVQSGFDKDLFTMRKRRPDFPNLFRKHDMLHPFDMEFEKPDYSEKSRYNDNSSTTNDRYHYQHQDPFYFSKDKKSKEQKKSSVVPEYKKFEQHFQEI